MLYALYLSVVRIPLNLNWSTNLYPRVFRGIIIFQIVAITTYAIIYYSSQDFSSQIVSFEDALYFSATTWTTLGFGDIAPPPGLKLITSAEALTGLTTVPVIAAIIWRYCQDRLWSKSADEALRENLIVEFDDTIGAFRDVPEERERYQEKIRRQIKIKPCKSCNSENVTVERFYDLLGRIVPLPKFVVRCEDCGNFTKPKVNAYLAAWAWNK